MPEGPDPNLDYALTDEPLTENRQYSEAKVKLNSFESFLRYRYEKNGRIYQAWYGGG